MKGTLQNVVLGAALSLLAAVGCGSSKTPPAGGGSGAAPITGELPDTCKASEDCELVSACCGCNAGGKQIAIRKDAVAGFEAARPERCGGNMCAQMISTDPSCDAEAVCGSTGHCEVAPHMGQSAPAIPPAQ